MRISLPIILILVFAFVFVGCGDDDDPASGGTGSDDSAQSDDGDDDDDDVASDDDDNDVSDDDDDDDDNDASDDDDDDDDFVPPTPVYGYYEEGGDWDWIEQQLPVFAQYDLTLFLGMSEDSVGDQDLLDLLFEAAAQSVEVRAWVLLPVEDGYWPGERNAERFAEAALAYAQWFIDESAPVQWIVVDMETDITTTNLLQQALQSGDYMTALVILLGHIDPVKFAAAADIYTEMVEDLEEMGFYSMVVTYPQVLDDMGDGDTFIQDVLDIPVSPVPWHEVSTMVYTTTFDQTVGMDFGPYLVYDYALSTVEYFGDAASIALGLVDEYTDPQDLADEVAAAKAAGIERIQVYSYGQAVLEPDPDLWHQTFEAQAQEPPWEPSTPLLRSLLWLVDVIF